MSYDISNLFNPCNDRPLLFSEIFSGPEEFIDKMESVGADFEEMEELYQMLALKYAVATTRYMVEEPFLLGLRRVLYTAWPTFLKRKTLMEELRDTSIEQAMKASGKISTANREGMNENLQNIVENVDKKYTNTSSVPINDLTTQQTSNKGSAEDSTHITENIDMNKIDAITKQYESLFRDYLDSVYEQTDKLFRVIL